MRSAVVLLALAALPACRTVRTVDASPTLEAAVERTKGRSVRIYPAAGAPIRNATRLQLTDSLLTYQPADPLPRASLRRREVRGLLMQEQELWSLGKGTAVMAAFASLALGYQFECSWFRYCWGTGLIVGAGIATTYQYIPIRERVVYLAPGVVSNTLR